MVAGIHSDDAISLSAVHLSGQKKGPKRLFSVDRG